MKFLLIGAFCVTIALSQQIVENGTDTPPTKNIRRQVPAYAAPYYTAPQLFAPPPPPMFAAPLGVYSYPAPAPIPLAPGPAYFPPPPPAPVAPYPAYQPPPPPPPPMCAPACIGQAACISGACACPTPVAYSPVIGCAPLPPPPPPLPVLTGRLIPQALPGAPCEPGVECTGGSVCSMGICLCPPELVQEGTVCVSRTIYGVVPPPPPPPIYLPAPVPVALAPGAPCYAAQAPCAAGAFCDPRAGVCQCGPAYSPYNGACVQRRRSRKEPTSEEKKPEEQ